jgi:hypothetical protein
MNASILRWAVRVTSAASVATAAKGIAASMTAIVGHVTTLFGVTVRGAAAFAALGLRIATLVVR